MKIATWMMRLDGPAIIAQTTLSEAAGTYNGISDRYLLAPILIAV